ncbi:protein FAM53C isoform 2-T2 [Macrochelys suwanniensis]
MFPMCPDNTFLWGLSTPQPGAGYSVLRGLSCCLPPSWMGAARGATEGDSLQGDSTSPHVELFPFPCGGVCVGRGTWGARLRGEDADGVRWGRERRGNGGAARTPLPPTTTVPVVLCCTVQPEGGGAGALPEPGAGGAPRWGCAGPRLVKPAWPQRACGRRAQHWLGAEPPGAPLPDHTDVAHCGSPLQLASERASWWDLFSCPRIHLQDSTDFSCHHSCLSLSPCSQDSCPQKNSLPSQTLATDPLTLGKASMVPTERHCCSPSVPENFFHWHPLCRPLGSKVWTPIKHRGSSGEGALEEQSLIPDHGACSLRALLPPHQNCSGTSMASHAASHSPVTWAQRMASSSAMMRL